MTTHKDCGAWEETKTPGGNPCEKEENMQTPHRKDPGHPDGESNPGSSCCEVAARNAFPTEAYLPSVKIVSARLLAGLANFVMLTDFEDQT